MSKPVPIGGQILMTGHRRWWTRKGMFALDRSRIGSERTLAKHVLVTLVDHCRRGKMVKCSQSEWPHLDIQIVVWSRRFQTFSKVLLTTLNGSTMKLIQQIGARAKVKRSPTNKNIQFGSVGARVHFNLIIFNLLNPVTPPDCRCFNCRHNCGDSLTDDFFAKMNKQINCLNNQSFLGNN